MLLLIAGLPGTGKTTVAQAYAALTGALHLNSDTIRRQLGLMGHYQAADKTAVYNNLLERARSALLQGQTVVIDSTFFNESVRAPFRALAAECGTSLRWVEVMADETTLRERLSHPRPDSEADFAVYEKIRDQYEALTDDRLQLHSELETPESAAEKIHQYLSR